MEPIILGCIFGKLLTIKAVHLASSFFAINGNADFLQREIAFIGDQGELSTPASILLPGNWYEWIKKKGDDKNAEFNMHFKLRVNVNTFWAPINSGATAHVDLEPPRAIVLPGIFGAYIMEEPHTVNDLFNFKISQPGRIAGHSPNFCQTTSK